MNTSCTLCPSATLTSEVKLRLNARLDFSEEAIPERDPSYRAVDGTLHEAQTIELLHEEARRALAQRLEQLGMSALKAGLVARM